MKDLRVHRRRRSQKSEKSYRKSGISQLLIQENKLKEQNQKLVRCKKYISADKETLEPIKCGIFLYSKEDSEKEDKKLEHNSYYHSLDIRCPLCGLQTSQSTFNDHIIAHIKEQNAFRFKCSRLITSKNLNVESGKMYTNCE